MNVFAKTLTQLSRDRLSLGITFFTTPVFVALFYLILAQPSVIVAVVDDTTSAVDATPTTRIYKSEDNALNDLRVGIVDVVRSVDGTVRYNQQRPGALQAAIEMGQLTAPMSASRLTPFNAQSLRLIIFALLLVIFTTAIHVAKERETHLFERLLDTKLGIHRYVFETTAAFSLVALLSMGLTVFTAVLFGFRDITLSLPVAIAIIATTLFCVSLGMSFGLLAKNTAQAFATSSVALFAIMFLSRVVLPLPRITLTKTPAIIDATDFLVPTHAIAIVTANTEGVPWTPQLTYHLVVLVLLSVAVLTCSLIVAKRTVER